MHIQRWVGGADGRSQAVAFGDLIWIVANARVGTAGFRPQVLESLNGLESRLLAAGSARSHLLSIQVLLTDMENHSDFDAMWREWIGSRPEDWPQRACFQTGLAPGLLVELMAVAAPVSASRAATRVPAS